jgi:hypothetical protein
MERFNERLIFSDSPKHSYTNHEPAMTPVTKRTPETGNKPEMDSQDWNIYTKPHRMCVGRRLICEVGPIFW